MAYSAPDALVSLDVVTLANYNKIRDSVIATPFARFALGGSKVFALTNAGSATWQDAINAEDFQFPSSTYTGHVYKLVVECITQNASTTITPRLYNVTDAAAVTSSTGSAGTATAWGSTAEQISSALTLATSKRYRLQFSKSDDVYEAWGIGYLLRIHA